MSADAIWELSLKVHRGKLPELERVIADPQLSSSFADGAPTDHCGRLQSEDAQRHARSIVDAIAAALA